MQGLYLKLPLSESNFESPGPDKIWTDVECKAE